MHVYMQAQLQHKQTCMLSCSGLIKQIPDQKPPMVYQITEVELDIEQPYHVPVYTPSLSLEPSLAVRHVICIQTETVMQSSPGPLASLLDLLSSKAPGRLIYVVCLFRSCSMADQHGPWLTDLAWVLELELAASQLIDSPIHSAFSTAEESYWPGYRFD